MIKGYRNLSQLVLRNARGVDYEIEFYVRSEDLTIVVIHGGDIEPLTSELAHAIAGKDYNLFEFRGIRASNNMKLHVSSLRFMRSDCEDCWTRPAPPSVFMDPRAKCQSLVLEVGTKPWRNVLPRSWLNLDLKPKRPEGVSLVAIRITSSIDPGIEVYNWS